MTLRAKFSPDSEDAAPTIEWLNKSGVAGVASWQEVHDLGVVEIQLRETPPVLAYLSQLEDTISISRVTSEGLVFYLTDVPLWHGVPDGRRKVTSERADGFLFVPMSNVVCLNAFGSIYGTLSRAGA